MADLYIPLLKKIAHGNTIVGISDPAPSFCIAMELLIRIFIFLSNRIWNFY